MRPIPIFMYHHVSPHKGDMVTVTPDVFEAQMRFLAENGYRTLCAGEIVGYAAQEAPMKYFTSTFIPFRRGRGDKNLPSPLAGEGQGEGRLKAVAVTFDDGYLDNYVYVFHVLKKYNIKATIFIVTDWVEAASLNTVRSQGSEVRSNEIIVPSHNEGKSFVASSQAHKVIKNWDMVKEMQDSGLIDFYSHTMTHRKCAELAEEDLIKELKYSKAIIEENLNAPCPYLCWPKGSYSKRSVEAAKGAGYKALFTTERGIVKKGSDVFSIKRIVVKDNIIWFKNRVRIYTNPLFSWIYLTMRGSE